MQGTLAILVRMFDIFGLYTNMCKTKEMTYTHVNIWLQLGKDVYNSWMKGDGINFWERKWTRVSCSKCGITMVLSSHKENHWRILAQTREGETGVGGRERYVVLRSDFRVMSIGGFPVKVSHTG